MIIAVTGHRPDKLFGYDLNKDKRYLILRNKMESILKEYKATHCITGMALGVDTIFAFASLRYRDMFTDVNSIVECAIPCRNHTGKWKQEDKDRYLKIVEQADIITKVSNEEYKPWLMQKRNEYMVNKCDILLAVWDGSKSGGTYNCVKYAEKIGKKIVVINPNEISENSE